MPFGKMLRPYLGMTGPQDIELPNESGKRDPRLGNSQKQDVEMLLELTKRRAEKFRTEQERRGISRR